MRNLQLEYGAEIGRAVVNFDGPIVFVVISRYHGGAFVVFSKTLNENMTVLALQGSFASVIGGAPAAAVVFAGEVGKRTGADPRVADLDARLRSAGPAERPGLQAELAEVRAAVRAEKISEVAAEFDGVHNIHRAVAVRYHPRPGHRKAVGLQPHLRHQRDVFLHPMIVVAGDTEVRRSRRMAEHIDHRRPLTVFIPRALNLIGRGGGAPQKTVREPGLLLINHTCASLADCTIRGSP